MRTIVITNQKGGCGKTTTAVNLAAALVEKGQRVLIVDLDPQAHATLGLGFEPDKLKRTIYHSLSGKQIPLAKIIVNTKIDGLDLAPSSILLAKAEQELIGVTRKEFILAEQLQTVSSKYDTCMIDCPPSLGLLTFNALVASTDVIIPVQVHYYALEGLKQLLETVKTTRRRFYPCSVKILGILLTFVEGKAALSQQVEQQMRQFFGKLVFDTVIHNTITLAEAPSAGVSIGAYAPESRGAADYKALADEIAGPDFRREARLPKEVSDMVEEAETAQREAEELEPSAVMQQSEPPEQDNEPTAQKSEPAAIENEPAEQESEPPAEETRIKPPIRRSRGIAWKVLKGFLIVLAIAALLVVIAAAGLLAYMNMINNPPVARPDTVTAQEDTSTPITLRSSDRDGDKLSYYVISGPSHGKLQGTAPQVTYTPEANYSGPDSFTFLVNDGTVDSNSVTVAISVRAVNDAPVANPQSVTTKVDKSVPVVLGGSDAEGDALQFVISSQPAKGTLAVGPNFETSGKLVYTPAIHFTGTDSFTYKLRDGAADSAAATVSITVTANRPPVAELQVVTTAEDTPAAVNLAGNDPDADTLAFNVITGPSHGSLSGIAPNLTYTPNKNFNGQDNFTYKISDGTAESPLSTVTITVAAANDAPVATNETITALEDTAAPVLLAAIDPEGNPLTYSIVKGPEHGTLSGTEPNLIYTPSPNYNGPDGFTFKANDGTADSAPASMSIMVSPVDDPPTANSDNVTVKEDANSSITLKGSDPDGDALTFSVLRVPSHGKLTGEPPNMTYTPDPNFSWLDSFTFKVSDGRNDSVPATVLISVAPANDPPVAKDDKATTQEDTPVTIDVLANDVELDNELLTISGVTEGKAGAIKINPDGTLTYTPQPNFFGSDTFSYTVEDRGGERSTANVTVLVARVNDAPKITSKPPTTAMVDVLYTYAVQVRDPDGNDVLTYSLAAQPPGMTINSMTGVIQWTPNDTQKETYEVIVKVADSNSVPASDTQTFNLVVNPTPPKTATLKVVDGYDQRNKKTLSAEGAVALVQDSDGKQQQISAGSYVSYGFTAVSVPPGATITSVVLFVEHFEDDQFPSGKLQWAIGTGWPDNPQIWFSIDAPIRKGRAGQVVDSWDITSFANTSEKATSLQLQIQNSDTATRKNSSVDCVKVIVEWGWPVPQKQAPVRKIESGLVPYGPVK